MGRIVTNPQLQDATRDVLAGLGNLTDGVRDLERYLADFARFSEDEDSSSETLAGARMDIARALLQFEEKNGPLARQTAALARCRAVCGDRALKYAAMPIKFVDK